MDLTSFNAPWFNCSLFTSIFYFSPVSVAPIAIRPAYRLVALAMARYSSMIRLPLLSRARTPLLSSFFFFFSVVFTYICDSGWFVEPGLLAARDLAQAGSRPFVQLHPSLRQPKIERFPVTLEARDIGRCCFTSVATAYDDRGDPIAGVLDNFLCDPERARGAAVGTQPAAAWQKYVKPPDEKGTNNAFPGWRGSVDRNLAQDIMACATYAMRLLR